MARKSIGSSSPKSFRFSEGSSIEARCADMGFQGAWYEAKITRTPRQRLPLYTVTYSTLFADDSNTPLKASLRLRSFMRPRPPIDDIHANNVFGLHQLVEAYHKEGWWPGVVSKLLSKGGSLYSVCFPASREEFMFKSLELRRSLEWVEGEWVSVEDYLLDDEEGEHVMFREGTRVEVSRDRENFGTTWFVGTVVKFIGRTYFLVEYANIKVDSESSTQQPLKEIVDLQYIRPCPPMSKSTGYNVRDEVEAFDEDGWYFGVVVVILPGSRYIVRFEHMEKDTVVHHTSLRPHLVWTDGQWIHVSKDNEKEVVGGYDISSRKGKKPGFESGDESLQPLKRMKKVNMLEEHPQLAGEIASDIQTIEVNNKDRETALADPSPMESSPEKMIFSLSRISEMSELVEPALDKSPQQPHFRPLLKQGKELREGLACGLMMAFASLVTNLSNLRILDSEQDFEEKLKVLAYLEEHGFNTQPARARLDNLLEMRKLFGRLEEEKKSMGAQIEKFEEDKVKDNLLLSELEKSILELQERIKCVQGEITDLKTHMQATEERTSSVKIQFDALASAPW